MNVQDAKVQSYLICWKSAKCQRCGLHLGGTKERATFVSAIVASILRSVKMLFPLKKMIKLRITIETVLLR